MDGKDAKEGREEKNTSTPSRLVHVLPDAISDAARIIVLSSYLNMVRHAVVAADPSAPREHVFRPEARHWKDDPIVERAVEKNLISATSGRGWVTQICHNPEKLALIDASPRIFAFLRDTVYRGNGLLCAQPAGFQVFPRCAFRTSIWAHENFLDVPLRFFPPSSSSSSSSPSSSSPLCVAPTSWPAFVVLEADKGHRLELADSIMNTPERLAAAQRFFADRIPISRTRTPISFQKSFDLAAYSSGGGGGSRWTSLPLVPGSLVAWNPYVPFRFSAFRGVDVYGSSSSLLGAPLILAEIAVAELASRSALDLQNDYAAWVTRTVSSSPLRNDSFVKKFGNRSERQIVKHITFPTSGRYESPFVRPALADYFDPAIDDPTFFALRGCDANNAVFTWSSIPPPPLPLLHQ